MGNKLCLVQVLYYEAKSYNAKDRNKLLKCDECLFRDNCDGEGHPLNNNNNNNEVINNGNDTLRL